MERIHKWKHTKRKVEGLPMALTGYIVYDVENDQVISTGSDVGAERAVSRYLAIANNFMNAAAGSDLSSRGYFR